MCSNRGWRPSFSRLTFILNKFRIHSTVIVSSIHSQIHSSDTTTYTNKPRVCIHIAPLSSIHYYITQSTIIVRLHTCTHAHKQHKQIRMIRVCVRRESNRVAIERVYKYMIHIPSPLAVVHEITYTATLQMA